MKASCVKEKFIAGLDAVSRATGKRLSLPILASVYIEVLEKEMLLRATNLDLGVEIKIAAKVVEGGKGVFSPEHIRQFLAVSGMDDTLQLSGTEEALTLVSGKSKVTLRGEKSDDFPSIPDAEGETEIAIPKKVFVEGVQSVWWSAAQSGIKPELSSVYIWTEEDKINFVATDSFRLSEKKIRQSIGAELTILIPFKNAIEITKIIEKGEGDTMKLIISKNQCVIELQNIRIVSRLIDSNFPPYRNIIPKETVTTATILKTDLAQALKGGSVFGDKFNHIRLIVNPKENILELQSKNADIGEFMTTVPGSFEGKELELGFNHRYLTDCLQSIVGETIILSFAGKDRPLIIRGSDDSTFFYLVMPMNR